MDQKKNSARPYFTTRSLVPENQETPIHFLREWIIPKEYFFRRNHFPYPEINRENFMLPVVGEVSTQLNLSIKELMSMPSKTILLPLECSGNKRAYFKPGVYGEQWEDGAISQATWKGVPLRDILRRAGINKNAVEILFEGYDRGEKPGTPGIIGFERSLPAPKALHPDTIIAYELNGEPIPYEHGYPLRLIVPQWYAMASVKWLKKITVINYHFRGPFQTEDYVYYPCKDSDKGRMPVTTIKVSSLIQQPMNREVLDKGMYKVEGLAWTGEGTINMVEISIDGGKTWRKAEIHYKKNEPYSWILWTYSWDALQAGEYEIMSRACDTKGRVQPFEEEWNKKGYGYNAVYRIKVKIE